MIMPGDDVFDAIGSFTVSDLDVAAPLPVPPPRILALEDAVHGFPHAPLSWLGLEGQGAVAAARQRSSSEVAPKTPLPRRVTGKGGKQERFHTEQGAFPEHTSRFHFAF